MYIFEIAFNNKLGRELDRKSLCVYRQGQIPNGKMDITRSKRPIDAKL